MSARQRRAGAVSGRVACGSVADSRGAPPSLERARQLIEPSLRAAVDRLEGDLHLPARYHFGWVDADGSPTAVGSGKGIRPALALLGAEAVGASGVDAVPVGVAVELIHNFSLVHDDIIDGDTERRHRPSVWSQFSVGEAVVVGDAMHTLAFQVLLDSPGEHGAAVAARLGHATSAMIRGQSDDMGFAHRPDVTVEQCLAMEADKTGALLAFAVCGGALMGGGDGDVVEALHVFGIELGVAFQAHDDILGVWGEPAVTGKPAGNDLRERKRSVPVVLALTDAAAADRARLRELFDRPVVDDDAVAEGVAILDRVGAREATAAVAAQRLERAIAAIDGGAVAPAARDELVELARFVVARDH